MAHLSKPPTYPSGACVACIHNLPCCGFHRAERDAEDNARSENISHLLAAARRQDIDAASMRHGLESDEFSTRTQKAKQILAA